jgi:hypothetical protein
VRSPPLIERRSMKTDAGSCQGMYLAPIVQITVLKGRILRSGLGTQVVLSCQPVRGDRMAVGPEKACDGRSR